MALGWQLHPLPTDAKTYYYAKDGSSALGYSADMVFIPTIGTASVILSNVNAIGVPDINLRILAAVNKALS